jgi:hypothetical protein
VVPSPGFVAKWILPLNENAGIEAEVKQVFPDLEDIFVAVTQRRRTQEAA